MFGYLDADDRVKKVHQLKNVTPSAGMTVRVEDYAGDSNLFGDGVIFIWDDNITPPRRDTEFEKLSTVDGYRPGDANEGAWLVVGLTGPEDQGLIVARPDSGPPRAFKPSLYDSFALAINAADTYVSGQGGGIIRIPLTAAPLDYGTISLSAGVTLVSDHQDNRLMVYSSSTDITDPGVAIADSSGSAITLTVPELLEINGLRVTVKRKGGNGVTVETATDATLGGSTSESIGSDGGIHRYVYNRSADNWERV